MSGGPTAVIRVPLEWVSHDSSRSLLSGGPTAVMRVPLEWGSHSQAVSGAAIVEEASWCEDLMIVRLGVRRLGDRIA